MDSDLDEEEEDLCSDSEDDDVADLFSWKQSFREHETVDLLNLEKKEFKNIFTNLGRNQRVKARAERLQRLIVQKKLAWWKIEDPQIFDVLGIDSAQYRRIKLIMAKLSHRIEKDQKRRQLNKELKLKQEKEAEEEK